MPARSVCLVTLSLSEAGPGRFGGQVCTRTRTRTRTHLCTAASASAAASTVASNGSISLASPRARLPKTVIVHFAVGYEMLDTVQLYFKIKTRWFNINISKIYKKPWVSSMTSEFIPIRSLSQFGVYPNSRCWSRGCTAPKNARSLFRSLCSRGSIRCRGRLGQITGIRWLIYTAG